MALGPATAARTNERNEAERALRVAPLAVVEPRVGIDNARHSHGFSTRALLYTPAGFDSRRLA
jgi:hypothetical protein